MQCVLILTVTITSSSLQMSRCSLSLVNNLVCDCIVAPCIKDFGCFINNSLHLVRKYARIFVRGHYLFQEANSKFSESVAQGNL